MKTRITALVLAALAAPIAGCGETDKAGGSGDEVTIRVGTDDTGDKPAAKMIDELARQAARLSGGRIRIKPVHRAAGMAPDDWDQKVARMVVKGDLEAGIIPSRAWDTEGVETLRPLSAPFLLTSDEAVNQVTSGELADDLMAGLREAGVVGLALIPEGLRHPFGFGDPLVGPDDYRGEGFRTPRSDTTFALYRALGARPNDAEGGEMDRRIKAGELAGADTSFVLASGLPVKSATANVTFFPKVNAIVFNEDIWEDLDDEQRSQLREAARRTRDWAIETATPEAESAATFCDNGGRIVMADDADIDALVEAARPVYAELEREPRTAALIGKIRAVAEQVPPVDAGIEPCGGRSAKGEDGADDGAGGRFPDGVYRTEISIDELVEKGMERSTAREYNGVQTVTFRDGDLVGEGNSDVPFPPCHGFYESTASAIDVTFADETCSGGFTAKWTLRDDVLRFTDIRSSTPEEQAITSVVFAKPYKKIK